MPDITRRDFLNGVALSLAPAASAGSADTSDARYPLEHSGLQGHTDELAAQAHRHLRDQWRGSDGVAERDEGTEDLVVVGAGLSGLAGAWWFMRHAGRPVRILLLDALDDFGGHARRNEFVARNGRRLVGYGGSQSLDSPGLFSPAVKSLLADLGLDLRRFETEFFDAGWAVRHGLTRSALHFGHQAWGRDALVLRERGEPAAQWLARTPLSATAQADWLRLLTEARNPWPGLSRAARRKRLAAITYTEFLKRHWRVDDAVVRALSQDTLGYFGAGADAVSALDAFAGGQPGFSGLDLGEGADALMSPSGRQLRASTDDYVHHFPDGNAGVARALVRGLLPQAVPGQGMQSLADARVDYARLDQAGQAVRLRLKATLVGLRHMGPPAQADSVELRYVDGAGTLRSVRARQVLLACWHRVIARLTDELSAAQVTALNDQVKVPLVYANVLLSNWQAWQRAGVHSIKSVDGFWNEAALDFPVSMGGVKFAATAEEPMLVHLAKVVLADAGQAPRQQAVAGRRLLGQWSFADFEAPTRELLDSALGPFGFDSRRDIEAITVNRWSHGYAYEYMRPWDRYWPAGPLPCETARRGWGRVAIANADAGAYAYAHSAIDQAARAVAELLPSARLPAWHAAPGPDPKALGLAR